MIDIDTYCDERGIEQIDFVKMDIEGHELMALKGCAGLLERGHIRALSFEFGGCNIDSRTYFQDFWYLLRGVNFRLYRVLPDSSLLRIKSYTEQLEVFTTTNYFAVHESISDRLRQTR